MSGYLGLAAWRARKGSAGRRQRPGGRQPRGPRWGPLTFLTLSVSTYQARQGTKASKAGTTCPSSTSMLWAEPLAAGYVVVEVPLAHCP